MPLGGAAKSASTSVSRPAATSLSTSQVLRQAMPRLSRHQSCSTWEVESEVAAGRLTEVLADFAAPPNGIYAVFPQRKHLPLRVRLWIDFLKQTYSQPQFWKAA